MKLYFMKQSALDYMKANIKTIYINYYRKKTNQWILDLFDYDPFEFFMEVPDFELAAITKKRGETELENCRILYSNLFNISESQASDERLWAGLCNSTFYDYVRKRWDYDNLELKDAKKDSETILSRFFIKVVLVLENLEILYQNAGGLDIMFISIMKKKRINLPC